MKMTDIDLFYIKKTLHKILHKNIGIFTEPLATLTEWSYGYPRVTHNYSRVIYNYHN